MSYCVYAVHAFSNRTDPPSPLFRVASLEQAELIAASLRLQRFTTREGARILRYQAVFIEEAEQ